MRALLRPVFRVIVRLLFRVDVQFHQSDFSQKKLLIVANHESFLDGLLLGLYLPIDPVFVVHTGLVQHWYFRLLLSLVDYLVVDPASPMAIKQVIRLIESGRPVLIFPEGRITQTGSLMKVYDGPAFVAAKTGAAVISVRVDGASRSCFSRMSGKYPKQFFPKIRLTILPMAHFPMPVGLTARKRVPAMLNYTAGTDAMQAACDAAEVKTIITSRAFIEQAKLANKLAGLRKVQLHYLEDIRDRTLLFDFILKRQLNWQGHSFSPALFNTRRIFAVDRP